jgi:lauroyl/myristoyl acyltransferase
MMEPRASAGDAGLAVQVAAAAMVSWVVPEALWRPLTRAIGRIATAWTPSAARPATVAFDGIVAGRIGCSPRDLAIERVATGHLSRLYGLRQYRPWHARAHVDVDGLTHLSRATRAGTGAVLWVAASTFGSLVTKMGLHGAGFAVSHLSRPEHGFGASGFAIRQLNPCWTRIERRFLRERIVMEPGAEAGALRRLRRRLAENGLVSITVGDEGVRTVEVPLLGIPWRVATGPVSLAAAHGAPLLPVFAFRDDRGRFRVVVEEPLAIAADATREQRELSAAREYAARLEPWVLRYPGQWML